jgi:hypothetical protein
VSVPGTIAITADEAGRYTQFAMAISALTLPPGTKRIWQVGNDIAGNRNRAVEQMEGEWLWFIDDDHAFNQNVLLDLIENDVDIVAPAVMRRQKPFRSVACSLAGEALDFNKFMPNALVEVLHTGSSGMLVRKQVFEAIEPPWFEMGNGISEDVIFCQKAREAGFDVFVDLAIRIGHITTAVVWPVYDEELGWVTGFTVADGFQIATEIVTEELA